MPYSPLPLGTFRSRSRHVGFALGVLATCAALTPFVSACSEDPSSVSSTPRPPPTDRDGGPSFPPDPPPLPDAATPIGPGTLVFPGQVEVVGATEDGVLAYFIRENGSQRFEVYDTQSKVRTVLAPFAANSDRAVVAGKVVAHWGSTRAPFAHGSLTLWTQATGSQVVPGRDSIGGVLAVNEDSTRAAISFGPYSSGSITNVAIVKLGSAEPPTIVAPDVGVGCFVSFRFAGMRLFTSTCRNTVATATVRGFDPLGQPAFVREGQMPTFTTSAKGEYAATVSATGELSLVDVAVGTTTRVSTEAQSALLSPDATSLFFTTQAKALRRASTTSPQTTAEIRPSGVRDILALAPDQSAVMVSSDAVVTGTGINLKVNYAMDLVSLTPPYATTTLLATPTGAPWGFSPSSKHAIYVTDIGKSALDPKLRATPVAGGAEIVLGSNGAFATRVAGSSELIVSEYTASFQHDLTLVDLEKGAAPKRIATEVGFPVVVGRTVYVGFESVGLHAIALPPLP